MTTATDYIKGVRELATRICGDCGEQIPFPPVRPVPGSVSTGYATTPDGGKICYACAAKRDRAYMRTHNRWDGYLVSGKDPAGPLWEVTNWPGSLRIRVRRYAVRNHNWGGEQVYVWFTAEGYKWMGRQVGDNDIVRCRRVKG